MKKIIIAALLIFNMSIISNNMFSQIPDWAIGKWVNPQNEDEEEIYEFSKAAATYFVDGKMTCKGTIEIDDNYLEVNWNCENSDELLLNDYFVLDKQLKKIGIEGGWYFDKVSGFNKRAMKTVTDYNFDWLIGTWEGTNENGEWAKVVISQNSYQVFYKMDDDEMEIGQTLPYIVEKKMVELLGKKIFCIANDYERPIEILPEENKLLLLTCEFCAIELKKISK